MKKKKNQYHILGRHKKVKVQDFNIFLKPVFEFLSSIVCGEHNS